ncbi:MAG: HIT domain-containing protein [Anaerolineales bacterium]|nr:HIT domain-containing protein [Anaerolineales bacterium]
MNHLFTPWRMSYITNNSPKNGCVFCLALAEEDSDQNLIVFRGAQAFVILNRFPYTNGHVMVLPYEHCPTLEALDPITRAEMMELTTRATQVLTGIYYPQGFNVGINLGEAAGAGVAAHLHIHIVPRWVGDVNFMTAVGETRVLPEALEVTWKKVREAWPLAK